MVQRFFLIVPLFVGLLFSGCAISKSSERLKEEEIVRKREASYFFPIPIIKFTDGNLPCLLVKIEKLTFPAELDLGFRGLLRGSEDVLETIKEKTFVHNRKTWGFGGKEYVNEVYQIPFAKMGCVMFSDLFIEMESEEFVQNSRIKKSEDGNFTIEGGRIGWEIFECSNLLLDVGNESIALCDGLDTLKEEGYSIDSFVSVPLWTERGFVEFEAETSRGPLRCVLDSGCTCNILQHDDVLSWNPDDRIDDPVFRIGGRDFKSQSFLSLPIQLPIVVEEILGMDFL